MTRTIRTTRTTTPHRSEEHFWGGNTQKRRVPNFAFTVITARETQTLGKNTVNDLHHHLSLHIVDAAAGYSGTTSKSLMREAQLSSCNKRTADGRDRQLDRQIGVTVILWRVCISPWKPKSLEYIPDWSYSRQSRTSNITYVK